MTDSRSSGVDMCYHFETGLVGTRIFVRGFLFLFLSNCSFSIFPGQCLDADKIYAPDCDRDLVISCHPFPQLAEAVFDSLPAVPPAEDREEQDKMDHQVDEELGMTEGGGIGDDGVKVDIVFEQFDHGWSEIVCSIKNSLFTFLDLASRRHCLLSRGPCR